MLTQQAFLDPLHQTISPGVKHIRTQIVTGLPPILFLSIGCWVGTSQLHLVIDLRFIGLTSIRCGIFYAQYDIGLNKIH